MNNTVTLWYIFAGILFLSIGVLHFFLKRAPLTSGMVYLLCGIILGPAFLGFIDFDVFRNIQTSQIVTELVVIISVFVAGLKMKPSMRSPQWTTPLLLAYVSLTLSVGMLAFTAHHILGIPFGYAVLLGAILAPTDPVLASSLQVESKEDTDHLRFTLTAEAGMNDGSTFPFLFLGLGLAGAHELGAFGLKWIAYDVLVKITGAVAVGFVVTKAATWALHRIKSGPKSKFIVDELAGLGLLFLVYGLCLWLDIYGFVAAFVAGVLFRKNEELILKEDQQQSSEQIIQLNDNIERLGEFVIILFFGSIIRFSYFAWPHIALALILFFIVRPLSVQPSAFHMNLKQRILTSWFGIRGVGSLFYLSFALLHIKWNPYIQTVFEVTVVTITLSILFHGITANPLMGLYRRKRVSVQSR